MFSSMRLMTMACYKKVQGDVIISLLIDAVDEPPKTEVLIVPHPNLTSKVSYTVAGLSKKMDTNTILWQTLDKQFWKRWDQNFFDQRTENDFSRYQQQQQ